MVSGSSATGANQIVKQFFLKGGMINEWIYQFSNRNRINSKKKGG
jgi:hypothetical protein